MILLSLPGSRCALRSAARLVSQNRCFEIRRAASVSALPAALLALVLCFGAPCRQVAAVEFQALKYFTNADGAHPFSNLIQGSDGKLYGTTVTGNNNTDHDTIFRIDTDGSDFTVLKEFDSPNTGANCWGGLLLGSDGKLYGTTYYGGSGSAGTVFKMNQDGTGFTVLKNFDASTTGGASYAPLIQGGNGVLYGTTYVGGTGNAGTVFKLNPDGSGFTVLKHFSNSTTGGHPTAAVTLGPDGALYGTAYHGGSSLVGTIFKINTDGSGFTVLQHLDAATTGAHPQAGLLLGSDDALYGTASEGGDFEAGTVFKLNSDGTGFTLLKSLDSAVDGAYPCAALIQGGSGKLYGTTIRGGSHDWGTVFEMDTDGTGYRAVKRFDYATTGGWVYAGLVQGNDGALYGAAAYGWDDNFGTLFRLVPTENTAPTAVPDCGQVYLGETAYLAGSASYDDDTPSASLVYDWSFLSIPSGSTATLDDATTATPSFTADVNGIYHIQLIVTDEDGVSSAPVTLRIRPFLLDSGLE